jgi:hypothetical protein
MSNNKLKTKDELLAEIHSFASSLNEVEAWAFYSFLEKESKKQKDEFAKKAIHNVEVGYGVDTPYGVAKHVLQVRSTLNKDLAKETLQEEGLYDMVRSDEVDHEKIKQLLDMEEIHPAVYDSIVDKKERKFLRLDKK